MRAISPYKLLTAVLAVLTLTFGMTSELLGQTINWATLGQPAPRGTGTVLRPHNSNKNLTPETGTLTNPNSNKDPEAIARVEEPAAARSLATSQPIAQTYPQIPGVEDAAVTVQRSCQAANTKYTSARTNYEDRCGGSEEPNSLCSRSKAKCVTWFSTRLDDIDPEDYFDEPERVESIYSELSSACPSVAAARYESSSEEYTDQLERVEGLEDDIREISSQLLEDQNSHSERLLAMKRESSEQENRIRELMNDFEAEMAEEESAVRQAATEINQKIREIDSNLNKLENVELPKAERAYQQAVEAINVQCYETAREAAEALVARFESKAQNGQLKHRNLSSASVRKGKRKKKEARRVYDNCKSREATKAKLNVAYDNWQNTLDEIEAARIDMKNARKALIAQLDNIQQSVASAKATRLERLQESLRQAQSQSQQLQEQMGLINQNSMKLAQHNQAQLDRLMNRQNEEALLLAALKAETGGLRNVAGAGIVPSDSEVVSALGLENLKQDAIAACCGPEGDSRFNLATPYCTNLGGPRDPASGSSSVEGVR